MGEGNGRQQIAALLAVTSAFVWSTYPFFVLAVTPGVAASALIPLPFLFGGAAYLLWAARRGHARVVLSLFRSPAAYLRIALIVGMQLAVLASVYVAGAVDTSLLSLVGDVALTPVLLILLYGEGRDRARSVPFVLGLVLSVAGAGLTILSGGSTQPITGVGWVIAPAVPIMIAAYFIGAARTSRSVPTSAVVGQATISGGIVGLFIAGLLPGGYAGLLVPPSPALLAVAGLGLTSFFVAPALYFWAIEKAGMILPSLLMAGIPVFTLGLSALLLHQVPPPLALLGIPVAVVGAIFAIQGTHPPWIPTYRRDSDSVTP